MLIEVLRSARTCALLLANLWANPLNSESREFLIGFTRLCSPRQKSYVIADIGDLPLSFFRFRSCSAAAAFAKLFPITTTCFFLTWYITTRMMPIATTTITQVNFIDFLLNLVRANY